MPQKSVQWRRKVAKRQGVPVTLKRAERSGKSPSAHAAKKSSYVSAISLEQERRVGVRSPPGFGSTARPAIPDRRAAERAGNAASGGGRPTKIYFDEHPRPTAKVSGRKKPPSRMNIKARGGPHKVSRLHGG